MVKVRATRIAINSLEKNKLPMMPPLESLSGAVQRPDWEALKAVLEMEHLVRCIEHFNFSTYNATPLEDFEEAFHGATYRLLLAGAVLCGTYLKPFLERDVETAIAEDIEFMRLYPVYNYNFRADTEIGKWKYREYENIFTPLARWLVQTSRKCKPLEKEIQPPVWSIDEEHRCEAKRLMELFMNLPYATWMFCNGDRSPRFGPDPNELSANYAQEEMNPRKVSVIFFGVFLPEQLALPKRVPIFSQEPIVDPHPGLKGTAVENVDIPNFLEATRQAYMAQISLAEWQDEEGPPADWDFFTFALRSELSLALHRSVIDKREYGWEKFWWYEIQETGGNDVRSDLLQKYV